MRSCKEIFELLHSAEKLSLLNRIETRIHLLICKDCCSCASQFRAMKAGFKRLFWEKICAHQSDVKKLEEETIQNILKKL